jgi:hypothetical protein
MVRGGRRAAERPGPAVRPAGRGPGEGQAIPSWGSPTVTDSHCRYLPVGLEAWALVEPW